MLHWFSGSIAEAQRASKVGCYFSINSKMLDSLRARRVVASLARDRILTETDGPFIKRGSIPLVPKDVEAVVSGLALLWGTDAESVRLAVAKNLQTLLTQGAGRC